MNIKTRIDEWEVRDLEDNSVVTVVIEHNTEMGNKSLPGLQVLCSGHIVNYEPLHVERWAYAAKKAGQEEYLLEDASWTIYEDRFIKHYLVTGDKPKAKVAVKVRSKDKPVVKEYELPFSIEG
jgi:hypothetical protein